MGRDLVIVVILSGNQLLRIKAGCPFAALRNSINAAAVGNACNVFQVVLQISGILGSMAQAHLHQAFLQIHINIQITGFRHVHFISTHFI